VRPAKQNRCRVIVVLNVFMLFKMVVVVVGGGGGGGGGGVGVGVGVGVDDHSYVWDAIMGRNVNK